MRAYRLVKTRYADTALDGSGAKMHGGRWNSRGVTVVYASETIALTALELLVHFHRTQIFNDYQLFHLNIPDTSLLTLDERALPADWRRDPPPSSTAAIGDEWIRSRQSLALSVPSTLVPLERNLLLNPAHRRYQAVLDQAEHGPFHFDERLTH